MSAAKGKTAYFLSHTHTHLPDASCLVGDTMGTATRTAAEAEAEASPSASSRSAKSVFLLYAWRILSPSLTPTWLARLCAALHQRVIPSTSLLQLLLHAVKPVDQFRSVESSDVEHDGQKRHKEHLEQHPCPRRPSHWCFLTDENEAADSEKCGKEDEFHHAKKFGASSRWSEGRRAADRGGVSHWHA